MLMHGCKEGQCASCKSFVLDGDDYRAGQVLDVRAARLREGRGLHAALPDARLRRRDDRAAQLRRGHDPVRPADPAGGGGGRVHRPRHATTCGTSCSSLSSRPEIRFFPGQYVDIAMPGTEPARSFSMANTSSRDSGQLEFVIKVYPDGLFSRFLDTGLAVGDRLDVVRAVRCLHPPRGPRQRPDLRRRRRRHGADPVPAAVAGRARHQPQGHLLLRRADAGRTSASRRSCARSRRRCRVSATCRRCRSRPTATAGRARSASSPTSCGGKRASSPTSTRTCAAHHRWSRRPSRCSPIWARPRNASTTTSSPRLVKPIPLQQ